ncbi:maleylacetoacetate isomerase [uncultured Hyphomonas sp.]|uniref:maleylacetoacetate isomerase n=1 Tax=uncultured Hyphomonas sp. TaxID=225298 RepID=UPI002AABC970|nr:maleylacetoacetate isomerase [uncultured Hyphomonas sp.]
MIRLYDYWRSSAAYRVRIALNIKGVSYEQVPVNIAPGADEQRSAEYRAVNPQMRVPSLEVDGLRAGQSTAIFEWLEETYPDPAILPVDPWERLQARSFTNTIACDIHPLNNLAVLSTLRGEFGADDAVVTRWYHDWIRRGFEALESFAAAQGKGDFLFGDAPTIAEITLVPQIANARRFDMDLSAFPALQELDRACLELDAFKKASPQANKPS